MDLCCLLLIVLEIVCVAARGGGGHGGHGGGHSGGHGGHGYGFHGGFHGHVGRSHVSSHHYSYHPPSRVTFTCRHCTHTASYPVYHGQPPAYVYQFRDSSNRYGDLLTGLALYNLGRSSAHSDHHSHYHVSAPDEKCSLQVVDKTHFEETTIDCVIMSSFLSEARDMQIHNSSANKVDIMSSNTVIQPTVDDGYRLRITSEQECMLWHNRTMVKERKDVPCALLKQYADTMIPSGVPVYIWLPTLVGIVITISLCCQYCRKTKVNKEEEPLNEGHMIGYCSNVRVQ